MSDDTGRSQRVLAFTKWRDLAIPEPLKFEAPPAGARGFRDANDTRIMRGCICLVADTLGNKRDVLEADAAGEHQAWLSRFSSALEAGFADLLPSIDSIASEERKWYQTMFSDTVILAGLVDTSASVGESEIGRILSRIGRFQLDLSMKGFFLRGGVSIGRLHMDGEIATGAALVRAAAFTDTGKPPGVYLDDIAASLIRHHMTYYSDPASSPPGMQLLIDNGTGRFFVNYLEEANYSEFGTDSKIIQQHAQALVSLKEAARTEDSAIQKVLWLCAYHNYFLDHCLQSSQEYCPVNDCEATRFPNVPVADLRAVQPEDACRIDSEE